MPKQARTGFTSATFIRKARLNNRAFFYKSHFTHRLGPYTPLIGAYIAPVWRISFARTEIIPPGVMILTAAPRETMAPRMTLPL